MPKLNITNITNGPKGVNTLAGVHVINPGQTVEGLELNDAEAKDLSKEWFKTGGKTAVAKEPEPKPGEGGDEGGDEAETYEAKHRGAGSFSILNSKGEEVVEGISKVEATDFNKLSDEEKAAFVAEKTK